MRFNRKHNVRRNRFEFSFYFALSALRFFEMKSVLGRWPRLLHSAPLALDSRRRGIGQAYLPKQHNSVSGRQVGR